MPKEMRKEMRRQEREDEGQERRDKNIYKHVVGGSDFRLGGSKRRREKGERVIQHKKPPDEEETPCIYIYMCVFSTPSTIPLLLRL